MRVFLRGLFAASLVSAAVLTMAATAHAEDGVGSVSLNTRVPAQGHAQPGFTQVLSTQNVPESLVGGTCDVVVAGENNGSVHPDSDIIVTSANTVTVLDVEREANVGNIPADGPLTLDTAVTVSVQLGADGVFSGGTLAVTFDCTAPPPPTTTTTPPSYGCTAPDGSVITTNVENEGVCTTTPAPPPSVTTVPPKCVDNPETVENDCVPTLPHTGGDSLPGALLGVAATGAGFGLVKVTARGVR